MAITISVSAGAKRPHPTEPYANFSVQASLSGEAGSLADVPNVMRDLFAAAQAGADRHLAEQLAAATGQPTPSNVITSPTQIRSPDVSQSRPSPTAASQPYRGNGQRRQSSPCSPAQARYLRQLGERAPQALAQALADQGVNTIEALSARGASAAIDMIVQAVA